MFTLTKELFTGKPFEFYSPYTLREIYQRLDQMSAHHCYPLNFWCRRRRLNNLQLIPVNETTFKFQGSRDAGHRLWITAYGIVHKESSGVYVTGKISMNKFTTLFMSLYLTMTFGLLIAKFAVPTIVEPIMPVPSAILILFAGITVATIIDTQFRLYRQLYDGLSK